MDATELRKAFDEFFARHGHTLVPSAGLIPTHPTAPMFTNSGMMQFVPYFLGEEKAPYDPPRAVSVQKCVRAGGKHNDLDAIGRSLRHLSFFEMLGNFSFGDYFKADAITWAWELVTEVLGIDGDRVWVTVHVSDDEAEIWADAVGFPRERIQRLDESNFWEMGEVGPCGPCAELFFDFGPSFGPEGGPANPAAEERYIEFWNLVFTQYFRQKDRSLTPLGSKNVDTGAGLERMLLVLQNTTNFYDTDVLAPLMDEAQSLTGTRIGIAKQSDIALRILADHTRTITFLINDGVVPSNEERGSVLRRIIRRAVRYADVLGVHRADVLPQLIERCIDVMGPAYPDLQANSATITKIVSQEEIRFRRTLERGSVLLDSRLGSLSPGESLPGETAFELYDTHGFPLELTQEIAAERDIGVDLAGYQVALERAQETSQKGMRESDAYSALDFQGLLDEFGPTDFVGREEYETDATILAVVDEAVFLDRSPFYAESGGQVGDTGFIETETGRVRVLDTTAALPGLHRHRVEPVSGTISAGQRARAGIDVERRLAIARNHTGTHILHWALRKVLGEHVKQQGSLVAPDRLRFDFGPSEALTAEQIREVEDLANHEILSDAAVHNYETTKDEAVRKGAIAFFGEKYGERVRVLEAGEHSIELCGGTHVHALGQIGQIKIVKEESIGANLRRVEAVSGAGLVEYLRSEHDRLASVAALLNVSPDEAVDGLTRRLTDFNELRSENKSLQRQVASSRAVELAAAASDDGLVIANLGSIERDALRDLALAVRDRPGIKGVVLGGSPPQGGAALIAAVRKDGPWRADNLLRDAAKRIQGGGKLNADIAIAGGRDASGIDEALEMARAQARAGGAGANT